MFSELIILEYDVSQSAICWRISRSFNRLNIAIGRLNLSPQMNCYSGIRSCSIDIVYQLAIGPNLFNSSYRALTNADSKIDGVCICNLSRCSTASATFTATTSAGVCVDVLRFLDLASPNNISSKTNCVERHRYINTVSGVLDSRIAESGTFLSDIWTIRHRLRK